MRKRYGFTLIELIIVVAIIGILAAVAIPKFSDLLLKSREGATKGNLSSLRSALKVYYTDNEGIYPTGTYSTNTSVLHDTLVPNYLKEIPEATLGNRHPGTDRVTCHSWNGCFHDYGGWNYYCYVPTNVQHGWIGLSCTHANSQGVTWRTYQ